MICHHHLHDEGSVMNYVEVVAGVAAAPSAYAVPLVLGQPIQKVQYRGCKKNINAKKRLFFIKQSMNPCKNKNR
jgi:hypothetical protein